MRNKVFTMVLLAILVGMIPAYVWAEPQQDLSQANELVNQALAKVQSNDVNSANQLIADFHEQWENFEGDLKKQSKLAYEDIEEHYGMVKLLFKQEPVDQRALIEALQNLQATNLKFVNGQYESTPVDAPQENYKVKDLLIKLQLVKKQVMNQQYADAVKTMDEFSSTWINIEGVVLSQSKQIYDDAERDIVMVKAYLKTGEPSQQAIVSLLDTMYAYLSPLVSKTSYTMVDAMTIILREGLEALLIVVALLAFLNRSGHGDKKKWIYVGTSTGIGVSVCLAILVQILFSGSAFGNNQFMINGFTGLFAAVMLIYMSIWLHNKSQLNQWQAYIKNEGSKALATGSLLSLGLLAFLGVLREGIEVVLFFIGIASSISTTDLLLGIGIGFAILAVISFLVLKLSVRIPVRPFFLVSSVLVFYLGLKFVGTGINSLQLAGLIPASTSTRLPSIAWLGTYPAWEVVVPQLVMIVIALFIVVRSYAKNHRTHGKTA